MKYRNMGLNCHNNLDIYGSWEDLKIFFIENSSENVVLNLNEINEILDWDRDLICEPMQQICYVFMTKENPPMEWVKNLAEQYRNLEFNLIYQNREKDFSGEVVYKNGTLWVDSKMDEDEDSSYYEEVSISL